MSASPESDVWDHWAENVCDGCQKDIPVAAGALCSGCALDFQLPDDPFVMDGPTETVDDVFAVRDRRVRPEPLTATEIEAMARAARREQGRP